MKWEYKVIKCSVSGLFKPEVKEAAIDQTLDQMGASGWELVSTQGIQTGNGATIEIVLILKRPKQDMAQTSTRPPPLP